MDIAMILAWIGDGVLWLYDIGMILSIAMMGKCFSEAMKEWKKAKRNGRPVDRRMLMSSVGLLALSIAMTAAFLYGTIRLTCILIG